MTDSMGDVYCGTTSVISFGKVPCTPVTGAYVNFYDVFGDVERIGTGSSCASSGSTVGGSDEQVERNSIIKTPSMSSKCRTCTKYNNSFDTTSALHADPYISFIQEKQVGVLTALHEEIRTLKHENSDLKFQIHVILRQKDPGLMLENMQACPFINKVRKTPESVESTKRKSIRCDPGKTLELELESATKMIEELKWIQQHYEKKIRMQELRIDELERQVNLNERENIEAFPFEVTLPAFHATKTVNMTNRHLKSSRQRSSSVHPQQELTSRRNSLQSILPDDYKQQVATLPPILTNGSENSVSTRCNTGDVRKGSNRSPSLENPTTKSKSGWAKVRKSNLLHSSNQSNNNAIIFQDETSQINSDAQFY